MKNCDEIMEFMSLYIDDKLDAALKLKLEEHLSSCEACKIELNELSHVIELCGCIQEEELPEGFKNELHARLLEEGEKKTNKNKIIFLQSKYIKIFSSLAAVFLIAVMLKLFLDNGMFSKSIADKSSTSNISMSLNKDQALLPEQNRNAKEKASVGSIPDNGSANSTSNSDSIVQFSEPATASKDENNERKGTDAPQATLKAAAGSQKLMLAQDNSVKLNSIEITIKSGDIDVMTNKIREQAMLFNAQFSNKSFDSKDAKSDYVYVTSFRILNSCYEQFVNSLKADKTLLTIEYGAVSTVDITNTIGDLNLRLNSLNSDISNVEKSVTVSNSTEQEKLKLLESQRDVIHAEIENLQWDSQYTEMTIRISNK